MRIVESGGVYTGKVEKIIDPDSPKDAVCKDCTDERKDKPVVGMTIIRNVKPSADDKDVFEGGDILDPNNGKVYQRQADAGRRRQEARRARLHRHADARPHADLAPRRMNAAHDYDGATMKRFNVRKVAVLGAGVMGAQIAAHLVNVKVPVILFDLPAKEGPKNGIVTEGGREPEEAQARAARRARGRRADRAGELRGAPRRS